MPVQIEGHGVFKFKSPPCLTFMFLCRVDLSQWFLQRQFYQCCVMGLDCSSRRCANLLSPPNAVNVTLLGSRVCADDIVKLRSLLWVPYPVGLVSPREWEIWVQTYAWGGCHAKTGALQPGVRGPHRWPATQQQPDWGQVLVGPSARTACGHPDLGLWPLELREDKRMWDLLIAPQETTATLLEKTHFRHQMASSCEDGVHGTPRLPWPTDCV